VERTCGRIRKKEAGEGRVRLNRSRASYPSPSVSPLSSVQRRLGFDMLTFSVKKVGGGGPRQPGGSVPGVVVSLRGPLLAGAGSAELDQGLGGVLRGVGWNLGPPQACVQRGFGVAPYTMGLWEWQIELGAGAILNCGRPSLEAWRR